MKQTKNFDVATIQGKTDIEIFTGDYLDMVTADVQAEVDAHKADLSTEATRKKTISFAAKIAKAKVRADDAGKNLNAERNATNEKVNERRRQLRDDFDRMRDQARRPVTEWEAAEEMRVEAERKAIERDLEHIEALRLNDEHDRTKELERKEAELERKQMEIEKAEEERLAKIADAEEEKRRIDREEKIRLEAAKQAARDALESIERVRREKQDVINKAAAAAKQAEIDKAVAERVAKEKTARDRIAAEEDKERAIVAERNRMAAEKLAEEKAAEKREADKKHKTKINNAALSGLVIASPITTDEAKAVVEAIAKGLIPHITISY